MAGPLRAAILLAALALAMLPSGAPAAGRLRHGVQLPAESFDFVTWDPVLKQTPDRGWRRWGTEKLIDTTELVLREYRDAHPDAPRVLVGDISRRHGGFFGARYGGLGHASHQTGLDVDVYYPRKDHRERAAFRPSQVDLPAAQELVNRFVAAGAIRIFVGPDLKLRGPRRIVTPLIYHDDHLHVRLSPRGLNPLLPG
jgi:murein endopeptidase